MNPILASVRNLRTWLAMLREKAQAAAPRGRKYRGDSPGADCSVLALNQGNAWEAKGAGHPRPNQFRSTGNRRNRAVKTEGSKPSLGGTSRVTGDSQARICERLGVKFPGPTRPGVGPRQGSIACRSGISWHTEQCTPSCDRMHVLH